MMETPFTHLYKASVNNNEGSAVILASDFMLEKIKVAEQIQFDGTFYTVPHLFYQLQWIPEYLYGAERQCRLL